ncbi:unnamed protein product [Arabidopsis arenosa]|uniref:DNA-directed DNA polymerase n=1 Tax=Arabidopsis arenosa TaxID=38785 RepID=A0A8S2B1J4_ARAAE|nr:unnamed protein product [Arabidopsis arenosa]
MKKKGAKKKGGSRGGRKSGSTPSTSKNDEPVVETSTQETQPTQEEAEETEAKVESPAPAKEGENEEETEENQEEEAAKVEPKPAEEEKEDAKPDSPTRQEKDETASKNNEAKGASSSQPVLRRGLCKRATKTEKAEKKPTPRAKRARTTKPQEPEPEYFKEKRNMVTPEDVRKLNLPPEHATRTPSGETFVKQSLQKIESSITPSDKIGVASVEGEVGEIIPMKMDWIPYTPLEKRDRQVDRMNSQNFHLGLYSEKVCSQTFEDINNPFKVDESEQSTVVQIMFQSEPPVECEYDWVNNDIQGILPEILEELLTARKRAKADLKEAKDPHEKAILDGDNGFERSVEELKAAGHRVFLLYREIKGNKVSSGALCKQVKFFRSDWRRFLKLEEIEPRHLPIPRHSSRSRYPLILSPHLELRAHPERYRRFAEAEAGISYEEYLTSMASDQHWGDGITLAAAAQRLGVRIQVVSDNGFTPFSPDRETTRLLRLSFLRGGHYTSLRPRL